MPEGSIVPRRFGHRYYDFMRNLEVYHLIPLHHFVKLGRKIEHLWNKYRFHRDWFEIKALKAYSKIDIERSDYWKEYYDNRLEQKLLEMYKAGKFNEKDTQ